MADIPITPEGTVPIGNEKYTFVERQGEEDISGVKNYPNEIAITINQDIAWQVVNNILDHLRYHPLETSFNLIIYGRLAEKV